MHKGRKVRKSYSEELEVPEAATLRMSASVLSTVFQ
jgi:hypothetical protein